MIALGTRSRISGRWITRDGKPGSDAARDPQNEPLYHYAIVRSDLPLGHLAAQLVHAAGESSFGNLPPNTHAVVLAARDEQHLLEIETLLLRDGVRHAAIREPDFPYLNAITAIGIVPIRRRELPKWISKLPLLR